MKAVGIAVRVVMATVVVRRAAKAAAVGATVAVVMVVVAKAVARVGTATVVVDRVGMAVPVAQSAPRATTSRAMTTAPRPSSRRLS